MHQTGLENRRSGNVTEGSNPSLSADFLGFSGDNDAAQGAPFASRSTQPVGAHVGTHLPVSVCGEIIMMRVEQVNAIIRAHHESADRSECGKFCYFAAAPTGLIKIGYSKDLKMRLTKLRNSHGDDMEILAVATGGIERESAYHFQFGEHRVEGEWFERHPDILAEIARLKAEGSPS